MRIQIEISAAPNSPMLMNKYNEGDGKRKDKNLSPREVARMAAHIDENDKLYLPTMNIFSCIINADKFHKYNKIKMTTARSSIIPAGVMIEDKIAYFITPENFEVDTRPVCNPQTGGVIISHRPILYDWRLPFVLEVDENMFTEGEVRMLVDDAGSKIGLGSFRPERKGTFGRFKVTHWQKLKD